MMVSEAGFVCSSDESFAVHQSRDVSLTKTTLAILYTLRCALTPFLFFQFGVLYEVFMIIS